MHSAPPLRVLLRISSWKIRCGEDGMLSIEAEESAETERRI